MEKTVNSSAKESFKNAPNMKSGIAASVGSSVEDMKDSVVEKAGPAVDYIKDNFRMVQETTRPYIDDAEALIKKHPFYAILGAAAVGTMVGMILSRPAKS